MKKLIGLLAAGVLSAGLALLAQTGTAVRGQGPGPSNAVHAYCDQDGDGLCDYCGLPVDQCRQAHNRAGQGRCVRRTAGGATQRGQARGTCPRAGAQARRGAPAQR